MVKLFPPKKDFNKNMRETAKPRNHVFLSFSSRLRFFFHFRVFGGEVESRCLEAFFFHGTTAPEIHIIVVIPTELG